MSTLLSAVRHQQQTAPHRPLVHSPGFGRALDAAALWDLHLAYVERLRDVGLRQGQAILYAAGNRRGFFALTLASRALRLVMIPVDVGSSTAELLDIAVRFGGAAVVTGQAISLERESVALGDGLSVTLIDAARVATHPDAAVMKITSGSTGAPKATVTTEAQLVADARQVTDTMRIGHDDTQLAVIPLSHSYGFSSLVTPLLLHGTPIVLRESFMPSHALADARACGARVFPGVPFMFQSLLADALPEGWPPRLRTLISAGAPLPVQTARGFLDAFGLKIHSFYGTSETGGIAYDDGETLSEEGTIGHPLRGVELRLVPEEGAAPDVGRILVRSAAVSSGYAHDDRGAFRDGGFLTGDYGRIDEDGRLVLVGRASSFVNVAGKKVEPGEVEAALRLMRGVQDVCVTAAPDARRGQQVVACIVVDRPLPVIAIRQFCARRLASHKIPRTILFVDAIPRTVRGKIDGRALAALIASGGSPATQR